jgi:hypothetical protein
MARTPNAHVAVGGGFCCPTKQVIDIFIICFIYYFLFDANLLPSSIPPHLNPHNRQVDDCVAGEEEVLIKGGQVDVLAEEMEEDVGVDLLVGVVCKKYEKSESCGSAGDFYSAWKLRGSSREGRRWWGMH